MIVASVPLHPIPVPLVASFAGTPWGSFSSYVEAKKKEGNSKFASLSTQRELSLAPKMAKSDFADWEVDGGQLRPFRILAIHGKGESGPSFKRSLAPIIEQLAIELRAKVGPGNGELSTPDVDIECHALQAPLEGGKWWEQVPRGTRSYEATSYEGYDTSMQIVRDAVSSPGPDRGYDVVLGHSQGAILLASMIANGDYPFSEAAYCDNVTTHSFVINGVAWPNPYGTKLDSMELGKSTSKSSDGTESLCALFVIGEADTMNPPESAIRVRDAFMRAGAKVETLSHPGGHSVPSGNDDAVARMTAWMVRGFGIR